MVERRIPNPKVASSILVLSVLEELAKNVAFVRAPKGRSPKRTGKS